MNISQVTDEVLLIERILLSRQLRFDNQIKENNTALGWQEKYFLIRVIHLYGTDCVIGEATDFLVPTLGMSYINIREVQSRLALLGLISTEKVHDKYRGRPVNGFKVHRERLLECLDDCCVLNHKSLIQSLLCWGERDSEACQSLGCGVDVRSKRAFLKDDNHELDGKSRVFLSVLLGYADEFGFVDCLGQSDIETMTAMTCDQQRNYVTKLKLNGYIRSVIKGFTNPKIFGQVQTVYCLNTRSAKIPGLESITISLFKSSLVRDAHELSVSSQLRRIANPFHFDNKSEEKVVQVLVGSFVDNSDWFVDVHSSQVSLLKGIKCQSLYPYIQFRLETYACWFLSAPGFNNKGCSMTDQAYQHIARKIQNDVSIDPIKEFESVKVNPIAEVFCKLAFTMAKSYLGLMMKCNPDSLDVIGMTFRVLPRLVKNALEFESRYVAIANSQKGYHGSDGDNIACLLVQDNRPRIQYEHQHLKNLFLQMHITRNEFDLRLKELDWLSEFSINPISDEQEINNELKIHCGLINF